MYASLFPCRKSKVTRRMDLRFLVLRTTLCAFSLLTRNVEGRTSSVSTRPTPSLTPSPTVSPTVSPILSFSSSESLKSTGISVSEASPATEVFVTNSTSVASQSFAQSSAKSGSSNTTTKTPLTTSGSVEGSLQFTTTEYVLIACLCVFFVVLITLIVLAVQIVRLNKTVGNLKAASHR